MPVKKKKSAQTVTWTIRNIPDELDRFLREKAKRERRTLTSVVRETLQNGFIKTGHLKPGERLIADSISSGS